MKREREGGTLFWGWWIVIGSFLILSMNYGSRYCFGVFVNPMFSEYQWSVSMISMAASINLLMYSTGGVISGWLLDRMAPKWIMTAGAIIAAVGFIMTSMIHTPAQLYLSYGVLCGLGSAGMGLVVSSSSVGKWFIRKRGVAVGIASMGIGFGTMALTPIAGYIVKNYEWRHGFIFFGILILLVVITVSQILMGKRNPEIYGLLPDGDHPRDTALQGMNLDLSQIPATSVIPVFKDFRFWITVFCFGAALMTAMMAFVHQVSYAIDNDIDKIIAASSVGVLGIASIFGRYFFGWFSDHLQDAKYSAFLGFLVMAAGMGILINTPSVSLMIVYAAVFGFGYGSLAPMMPVLLADRFGRYVLGSAYGWLLFFVGGVGGALGPLVGGLIYDSFGSYNYAWRFNIVLLIAAAFGILALKPRDTDVR
ncbi:MAG: MFS transporter [Deltaproteobacteria bacterium]|nr:MFS transporter [Deltaproteobacteria bacterium]